MSRANAEPDDLRAGLLAAWYERCQRRGVETTHIAESDARYLVSAVVDALGRGTETPDLGRAARTWGARFTSPVDALAAVTCLREVLTAFADSAAGRSSVVSTRADGGPRVIDQLMLESVDAAAGSLRASARIDPLTGCANRRALQEELPHAVASARRSGLDVSLAMIDLDGLKRINDAHGHAAGDATLISLVAVLRGALRDLDSLYRAGGDEFVIVSPFTTEAGSRQMLSRAAKQGGPSFSWGVASIEALGPQSPDDPERLLLAADADLYAARRARRRAAVMASRRRKARAFASVAASAALTASAAYGLATVADSPGPVLHLGAPTPVGGDGQGASAIHRARGNGRGSSGTSTGTSTSTPVPGATAAPASTGQVFDVAGATGAAPGLLRAAALAAGAVHQGANGGDGANGGNGGKGGKGNGVGHNHAVTRLTSFTVASVSTDSVVGSLVGSLTGLSAADHRHEHGPPGGPGPKGSDGGSGSEPGSGPVGTPTRVGSGGPGHHSGGGPSDVPGGGPAEAPGGGPADAPGGSSGGSPAVPGGGQGSPSDVPGGDPGGTGAGVVPDHQGHGAHGTHGAHNGHGG